MGSNLEEQAFREVVSLVYGEGASELIRKANPDGADLHGAAASSVAARKDKRKRGLTAGLSAIGATAGAAGLAYAGAKTHGAYKVARAGKAVSRGKAFKQAIKHEKFGAALVPLEVAGLTGEVAATHILHGDTKKTAGHTTKVHKGYLVSKSIAEIPEAGQLPSSRGEITRAVAMTGAKGTLKGVEYTAKGAKKLPEKVVTTKGKLVALKEKVTKGDVELTWEGEIAKADLDKQQLFGWASVIEVDGHPVVDLQGDRISTEEMEKSAYEYVVKSRKGGDMHLRDEWQPVQKSDMIESFMVTPEKRHAMGLPDSVPTGWWVGFQVHDPEVWAKVRSGERTGFSIHGRGKRELAG